MIAYTLAPGRITIFILTRHPGTTRCIQQVLRTQNVSNQEKLRIFNTAVYMTFSGKVHHIVEFELGKQFVSQYTVANVTLHKDTTFIINVFGDGTEVASISQSIQYHKLDIIMLCQNVLDIIRADKPGCTGYEISLH